MIDAVSMEESSVESEQGWSFEGGMVDVPKVGSVKAGAVRVNTSAKLPMDVKFESEQCWVFLQVL